MIPEAAASEHARLPVGRIVEHAGLPRRDAFLAVNEIDLDAARATFRALLVRLAAVAEAGVRDPQTALEPFVEALLELRARARSARDWPAADLIRDRLTAAGVEVHDGDAGSTWELRP